MLYLTPTLAACLIAIWFCYWLTGTGVFPSFRALACRIVCIATPILFSALLIAFPNLALNPLGDFINRAPLQGISRFDVRGGAAVAASIAVILTTFTLLIEALIGQVLTLRRGTPGLK